MIISSILVTFLLDYVLILLGGINVTDSWDLPVHGKFSAKAKSTMLRH